MPLLWLRWISSARPSLKRWTRKARTDQIHTFRTSHHHRVFWRNGQPNEHALMGWIIPVHQLGRAACSQFQCRHNSARIYALPSWVTSIKISRLWLGHHHALWIMAMAKLFSRDDGTSPLIGFNWSNSINNKTMELTADFRKALGFENVVRFEHHITETQNPLSFNLTTVSLNWVKCRSCRQYRRQT